MMGRLLAKKHHEESGEKRDMQAKGTMEKYWKTKKRS